MGHRIFTYFGTPIPPWKEEKLGRGGLTIFFVLTGKTPSKKNNQQAVTVRRHARKWAMDEQKTGRMPTWADVHRAISMVKSKMRGNKEYLDFLEKVKPVLQHQCAYWADRLYEKGLIFPLQKATMTLKFHFKDRYVTDTVNKQQTIQDVLKHCGIIANDDYKTLNPIHSASACYYEEIIQDIAFISISFKPTPPAGI
jgi:hypothetical protein